MPVSDGNSDLLQASQDIKLCDVETVLSPRRPLSVCGNQHVERISKEDSAAWCPFRGSKPFTKAEYFTKASKRERKLGVLLGSWLDPTNHICADDLWWSRTQHPPPVASCQPGDAKPCHTPNATTSRRHLHRLAGRALERSTCKARIKQC